jgi:hypothetical protein
MSKLGEEIVLGFREACEVEWSFTIKPQNKTIPASPPVWLGCHGLGASRRTTEAHNGEKKHQAERTVTEVKKP